MDRIRLPYKNNIYVDGKSVFNLYLQLKNHFNLRGDVIKKNWNLRVSTDAYNKRKDKFFFEKLATQYKLNELCLIFIGNFIANENVWVGDISDCDPLEFYNIYLSRLQAIETRYIDDIKNIYYFSKKLGNEKLSKIFEYNESVNTSYIFKLLQNGIISFETFLMLDSFIGIIDTHDKHDNIVWMSYSKRLKGYRSLFIVDSEKAKNDFLETLKSVKY